jgi:hypothetical protein
MHNQEFLFACYRSCIFPRERKLTHDNISLEGGSRVVQKTGLFREDYLLSAYKFYGTRRW